MLMTAHGVGHLQFAFDNGKRRVGCTNFVRPNGVGVWLPRRITLSRHFAELLSDDEIRDVILHEIAHARAGKLAEHGPRWKAEARAIGARPERCAAVSTRPVGNVLAWCLKCDKSAGDQHRLPLRVYKHSVCNEPLIWFKNGTRLSIDEMPARYQAEWIRLEERGMA